MEILIVGGAAGMVTGVLPEGRTTTGCDVMNYDPDWIMTRVEMAADKVGEELRLPKNWLNSKVQIRADSLPEGWKDRRIFVCTSGRLRVFAASRIDLIAMKVLAGRAIDLEDLAAMKITAEDVAFVREYLNGLKERGTTLSEIEDAGELLDGLTPFES